MGLSVHELIALLDVLHDRRGLSRRAVSPLVIDLHCAAMQAVVAHSPCSRLRSGSIEFDVDCVGICKAICCQIDAIGSIGMKCAKKE